MKRALRRHHRQRRIKAEYKKWIRLCNFDEEQTTRTALRLHSRRTPCSCCGCGNPRKHFGIQTLSETRTEISTKEQFAEQNLSFKNRFGRK